MTTVAKWIIGVGVAAVGLWWVKRDIERGVSSALGPGLETMFCWVGSWQSVDDWGRAIKIAGLYFDPQAWPKKTPPTDDEFWAIFDKGKPFGDSALVKDSFVAVFASGSQFYSYTTTSRTERKDLQHNYCTRPT